LSSGICDKCPRDRLDKSENCDINIHKLWDKFALKYKHHKIFKADGMNPTDSKKLSTEKNLEAMKSLLNSMPNAPELTFVLIFP